MTTVAARHPTVNALYSLVGFVVPLFVTLVVTRLVLYKLGVVQYGLYLFLLAIVNVVSFLDIGFYYAWYRRLAASRTSRESTDSLNRLFGTTLVLYSCVGLGAGMFFLIICRLLGSERNFLGSFDYGVYSAIALFMVLRLITIPFSVIPNALQRFDITTRISLTALLLGQSGMVAVVYLGYGVKQLLMVQVIISFFQLVLFIVAAKRCVAWLSPKFATTYVECLAVVRTGFWPALHNIFQTILTQFDKVVLGFVAGSAAVTYYASAQMLPEKMVGTLNSVGGILFPLFSEVAPNGSLPEDKKYFFVRTLRLATIVTGFLAIGATAYGHVFMRVWLGNSIAEHVFPAFYLLVVTYFFLALFSVLINMSYGLERTKILSCYTAILAVFNVIALSISIPYFGVTGAALAYLVAVVPVPYFLYKTEKSLYQKVSIAEVCVRNFRLLARVGGVAILSATISYTCVQWLFSGWLLVLVGGSAYTLLFFGIYSVSGFFESEDWNLLIKVFRRRI